MIRLIIQILIVFFLAGCGTVADLDQLLALKDYSKNTDQQKQFVADQNKNFEKMLAEVKAGGLGQYKYKRDLVKNFGQPVFKKNIAAGGKASELWLYRYATEYFKSDKVYIYFDAKGELIDWEYEAAPEKAENT